MKKGKGREEKGGREGREGEEKGKGEEREGAGSPPK